MLHSVTYSTCYHCRLSQPTAQMIGAEFNGQQQDFCCHGCLAAARFITALKLENFYQYQEKCSALTPVTPAPVKADHPDLAELFTALSLADDGHWELRLLVPDIRCAACVWLLEQALGREEWVSSVQVNFSNRRLLLRFNTGSKDRQQAERLAATAIDVIQRLGYDSKADRPDVARSTYLQRRRNMLIRLGIAGIGTMPVMMFAIASYLAAGTMDPLTQTLMRWASLALSTPVVVYSAFPFHRGCWAALKNRQLGMDVPVSLAIASAWLISAYNTVTSGPAVYFDTACMFTFFLLCGRYIELMSTWHFQQSQDLLTQLLPTTALRLPAGMEASTDAAILIPLQAIQAGDILLVAAGDTIPADGTILSGSASISEAAFTGEPLPLLKTVGDSVLAGAINHDGELLIRARCEPSGFLATTLARLCEQASLYRPRWTQLADRAATVFIASVMLIALGTGIYWFQAGAADFMITALTVLVVACPCALSLATPVAHTIAVTTLRKRGLVIKQGSFLERAAETDTLVFDKTGTLTEASLQLVDIHPLADLDAESCLQLASALEQHSEHPIARGFPAHSSLRAESIEVLAGGGISGRIAGRQYRIGNARFALDETATPPLNPPDAQGLWVLLASNKPLAWFRLKDHPRQEAAATIQALREQAYATLIISGDSSADGQKLCTQLAADHYTCGASPQDKITAVRTLQEQGQHVMMVGDGINDSGALAAADTSIAVMARDAFVHNSADAILLGNSLLMIPQVLAFARQTRRVIRQNILWSLAYNFTVIPFAVTGMLAPWLAALGMSLSSLLVVLNASRLQKTGGTVSGGH
ncbi:MAG: heavy metal translocating P-type ATPase [Pseudomonadales bacterium]|nr:heavy metal translocating P-type ATPase [Pseudomonadales bacterium]